MNETASEFDGWGGVDVLPPSEFVPEPGGTDTPTIDVSAPAVSSGSDVVSGDEDTVSVPAVSDGMDTGSSSESGSGESSLVSSGLVTSDEAESFPEVSGMEGEESMIFSVPDSSLLTSSEAVPIFQKPFNDYTLSEFSLFVIMVLLFVLVFFYFWKGGRH